MRYVGIILEYENSALYSNKERFVSFLMVGEKHFPSEICTVNLNSDILLLFMCSTFFDYCWSSDLTESREYWS